MAQFTALSLQINQEINAQNAKLILARKHDSAIRDFTERRSRYGSALEKWAIENREREFALSSTLELRQGTLRFRMGQRAVKFLEGWTELLVLDRLRKLKKFRPYLRITHEVNRQLLLSDTKPEAEKLKEKDLAEIGLRVAREEKFYIEPKLEAAPA